MSSAHISSSRPSHPGDSRIGYYYAALNAVISGFAIYINSLGVGLFKDSTLYTTLKNAVVGVALLLPLVVLASRRAEWRRLTGRQWSYLLLLAVIGGSVPYVLFFRGLQLSTPVTSSLLNHAQFLLVAALAFFLLRERYGVLSWLALVTLLIGTVWGVNVTRVQWSLGDTLVALSTVLFAGGVILAKYLLRELSTLTVMTAKMSIGSLILFLYIGVSGRLGAIGTLSGQQWSFVILTGLILLAFTVTAFLALRLASATVATAIPAASPLITTALVVLAPQHGLKPSPAFGLALMIVAVAALIAVGMRQGSRAEARQEKGKVVVA